MDKIHGNVIDGWEDTKEKSELQNSTMLNQARENNEKKNETLQNQDTKNKDSSILVIGELRENPNKPSLDNNSSSNNQSQNNNGANHIQADMSQWCAQNESTNPKFDFEEDKKSSQLDNNVNWNSTKASNFPVASGSSENSAHQEFSKVNTKNSDQFPSGNSQESNVEIFIRNLPYQVSENEVRDAFSACGNISRVSLPMQNGKSKGFGFVTFASSEGCKKAVEMDQQIKIGSRQISISFSKMSSNRGPNPSFICEPSQTLFLGNLPETISEDDIRDLFIPASNPSQIRIARRDGVFKGFAHVDFESIDDAKKALELHPSLPGRNLKINYASSRAPRGDNQKSRDFRGKKFTKDTSPKGRDRSREREYRKDKEVNGNFSSSNVSW